MISSKQNRKENLILLLIIAIALILRVVTINSPFYSDEAVWPYATQDHSKGGFNFIIQTEPFGEFVWTSPVLGPLIYRFALWPFEITHIHLRLISVIFGLLNIWLTFVLARKLFDKRVAIFSSIVMTISFWHLIESFLIEHDGSFLLFFFLLFIISCVDYLKTENKKHLIYAGIFFGLGLLVKMTASLMLITFGVIFLIANKKLGIINIIKKGISNLSITTIIGLLIFSIFPISAYLFFPKYIGTTVAHTEVLTLTPSLFSILRIGIYFLLWATPLLFLPAIIENFSKKDQKTKNSFLILNAWICTVTIFYVFSNYIAALDRYLSIIIPPLCIFAGFLISKLDKKQLKTMIATGIISAVILFALNFIKSTWIAHDVKQYMLNALTFKWNFIFQFHGGTGPSFMTSFIPLGVGLLAIGLYFLAIIILSKAKNKRAILIQKKIIITTIGLALGFNIFLAGSFIAKAPYADVGATTLEAIDYLKELNSPKNYYATDPNLAWYINQTGEFNYIYNPSDKGYAELITSFTKKIEQNGGLLIITNYPKRSNVDPLWHLTEKCTIKRVFTDKNIDLIKIYEC